MSYDFAHKQFNSKQSSKLLKWILLSVVVIVCVAVFLLMLHKHHGNKKTSAHLSTNVKKPVDLKTKKIKAIQPKFDFYAILPKEKVWLPKADLKPIAAPKKNAQPASYALQVAAFKNTTDANKMQQALQLKGYAAYLSENDAGWYLVFVGPFKSITKAQAMQVTLSEQDKINALIITKN